MIKMLWISNHTPLECQLEVIERKLGDKLDITQVQLPQGARRKSDWVKQQFVEGAYDELLLNAPLSIHRDVCNAGLKPWRVLNRKARWDEQVDFEYNSRSYVQIDVCRVEAVKDIYEDVQPSKKVSRVLRVCEHPLRDFEKRALQELFSDEVIIDLYQRRCSARETARVYESGGYDDMLIIGPWAVYERILAEGIQPLTTEMKELESPEGKVDLKFFCRGKERYFRFLGLRRLTEIRFSYDM